MRKKMLFLTLALAATAVSLTAPRADAGLIGGGPLHGCQVCTSYPDGSQCCVNCLCTASGVPTVCAENACVPVGGLG